MFYQKSILFVFALLISNALFAVTVTWTGAGPNNLWSNSSNWDTGTVPNSTSTVVIPSGAGLIRFNFSNRRAKSVSIGSGTTVQILSGAKLRIVTSGVNIGLINDGILDVRGTLIVRNSDMVGLYNSGTLDVHGLIGLGNQVGIALRNEGSVRIRVNGRMSFLNANGGDNIIAINGIFFNEGTIRFLAGGTGNGIRVGGGFENASTGLIIFEDGHFGRLNIDGNTAINNGQILFVNSAITTYPIYITPGAFFTNGLSGFLEIDGAVSNSGMAIPIDATFENRGRVHFTNLPLSSVGIWGGSGNLINRANATIEIEAGYSAIHVGGVLQNFGHLALSGDSFGMTSYGQIKNYEEGTIDIENTTTGIQNYTGAIFTNAGGTISFNNIDAYDINNEGGFYNLECGIVEGDNIIFNNGGVFNNKAWLSSLNTGDSHTYTQFPIVNTGIVIDPYDRFATALDNQEARVIALVNPQANVPYTNTFDITNISTSIFSEFYLDPARTIYAGSYNHPTNTYIPEPVAIGATTLYTKAHQGCSRVFSIRVDGGVLPVVQGQAEQQLMYRQSSANDTELKLAFFPNPTTGIFQAQLPALEAATYELQVLNAQGQIIAHQTGQMAFENLLSFDLSNSPAGLYWTRLLQDGQMVAQEKIILTK